MLRAVQVYFSFFPPPMHNCSDPILDSTAFAGHVAGAGTALFRTLSRAGATRVVALSATLLLPWLPAIGQKSPERASIISGVVHDDAGLPVVGVEVSLLAVETTSSDSLGHFHFAPLTFGTYFLRATKIGMKPVLKNITIGGHDTVRVEITSDGIAQQLAAIVVIGEASTSLLADPSGFARRSKHNQGGVFLTGDDIERRRVVSTQQLFMGIPDVRVDTGGIVLISRGPRNLREILHQQTNTDCIGAQVMVDGVAVPQPFDINTIAAGSIRGIEVYRGPATTPVELRTPKSVCGTIAIWSR